MTNLMISGNRSIRSLNKKAVEDFENVCHKHPEIDPLIVGDADGVDTAIQDIVDRYLQCSQQRVECVTTPTESITESLS